MRPSTWLRRGRGSVRLRVTLLAAGLFALTLAVASWGLLRALERTLVDDLRSEDQATLRAQALQVFTRGIPSGATPLAAESGAAFELPGQTGARRVIVMAPSGDVLTSPGLEQRFDTIGGNEIVYSGTVPMASAEVLGIAGDPAAFDVSSLRVGDVTFATASPLDAVFDTIAATRRLLWMIGPGLVALVAGLAWLLAGRALRPVHAVTSQVAAIGSHSLHERVPVPASDDEIAALARTMNGMLGRLETASATNRRLVSDASHELRTPIAVMRTELEVARRAREPDWATTSDVMLDELDRLQCLVDDLLLLARSDERAFVHQPFSIADVVRDVGARPRRVPLDVAVAADADPVVGDADAVRRAVDHVVANAARHARSRVEVCVESDATTVTVHVDDDGPGIPVARRGDVLRRFVRLDEGRSRDGGGAGLGLAVTSDVAAAHAGRLDIGDSRLGGARLSLVLSRGAD
ncbi:MAG: ATP-binding protein [Ilumatobacteraceae bacterium]